MKYCSHCGNELDDDAVFCPKCGCQVEGGYDRMNNDGANYKESRGSSTIQTIAKVFMVLSCVSSAFILFPLIWMIPMTVSYFKACNEGRDVSTGFKICTLLFVNMISGILMLVDNN